MKFERPKAYKIETETKVVTLRVEPSVIEVLDKAAEQDGLSRNELISGLLRKYAEWLKKGQK